MPPIRMRALPFLVVVVFGVIWASAQTPPYSIHVDVPIVSVDVAVTDSGGKAITNLTRSDFVILEDGIPQTIRNFSSASTPYDILLLFDCSESTRDRTTLLLATMTRFTDQLRPEDHLAIAAFGQEVQVLQDWNQAKGKAIDIQTSAVCSGTNFYEALEWSTRKLRGLTNRRGVIVLSDGFDANIKRKEVQVNGNKVRRVVPPSEDRDFQKALRAVRESAAPFYFVAVDTDINPGPRYAGPVPDLQQVRARLELLASESGGRIVFPREPRDAAPMFLQIGRELSASYSLGYSPEKTGANRGTVHIEVRVPGGSYRIQQSRTEYKVN
jgi:VWFA-related protein